MDLWTARVMKNSGSSVPGLRSPEVGNQILKQVLVNRSSIVGCVGRERRRANGHLDGVSTARCSLGRALGVVM